MTAAADIYFKKKIKLHVEQVMTTLTTLVHNIKMNHEPSSAKRLLLSSVSCTVSTPSGKEL